MSRGIADSFDEDESGSEEVTNNDLSEMIFILFNELRDLSLKVDLLIGSDSASDG